MMLLTLSDQRFLNRRARAHGLPDLWPEAEREAAKKGAFDFGAPFGTALTNPFYLSGMQGDPLQQQRALADQWVVGYSAARQHLWQDIKLDLWATLCSLWERMKRGSRPW